MTRHHKTDSAALSKGQQTRAAIIASAKRLFYEHGYEGTSFSDIVDASNLQRGNIYHYFKTKDDILKAVIREHLSEFRALLDDWDERYPEPRARLLAFVHMIAGRKLDLVHYGCPIGTLNTELGKNRVELQTEARALFDLFKAWLATCFAALGYQSEAEWLALHLLGRAEGIAVIAHVYREPKLLRRETEALQAWIEQLAPASAPAQH